MHAIERLARAAEDPRLLPDAALVQRLGEADEGLIDGADLLGVPAKECHLQWIGSVAF